MEFLSGQINFKVDAWATFRGEVFVVDSSGNPIDVTSWGQWTSYINWTKTGAPGLANALGSFGINVVQATGGQVELFLSAAQTGALWKAAQKLYSTASPSGYLFLYWDLLGTAGSGDVTKVASGTLQLVGTVSH